MAKSKNTNLRKSQRLYYFLSMGLITKKLKVLVLLTLLSSMASSQVVQSLQFVQGSISDGEKIVKAYLLPVENSFNAIGHTGLIHINPFQKDKEKFSFSITLDLFAATAPSSDRTYDVNKLQLENFKPSDPNKHTAQTYAGGTTTIQLETKETYRVPSSTYPFYEEKPLATFDTPKGVSRVLPFASVGLVLGSPNFSISFRTLPLYKLPGVDGSLIQMGGAIQLKVNKLFTFIQTLPVDVIVSGGFDSKKLSINPNIKPENSNNENYNDQEFYLKSTAFPFQLAISKNFRNRINAYLSGGYNLTKSRTGLVGTYPLYKSDPTHNYSLVVDEIKDPFEYSRGNSYAFAKLGLGYYFKVFGFSSEFTLAKYLTYNFKINIMLN